MQLIVVTRLVALKSLLLGATSFQLQPPSILTPYHHHFSTAGNTPDSPVGWNLPMQKDSSSSELPSTSPPPPPVMLPFATPGQVKQTLAAYPNSVLLDVRTEDEIVQLGHLHVPGHRWIHTSCTPMACPLLSSTAGDALLPDKQVPVIVYCGSGKRAAKAKEVLEGKGYLKVLNAGAFGDLTYLRQE